MESQQLVTIIPWTFIAQILNLFIQVYLIKRFLFKPINEVLKKRQEAADKDISRSEDIKVYAFNNVRIYIPKSFAPLYMDRLKSLLSL